MATWGVKPLEALASLGVAEDDAEPLRAQKIALTIAAMTVIVLAVIWVATYAALGLMTAALIPFAYQLASVVSVVVFARTKSYGFFRLTQAMLMTVLPFLLQWNLGGYVASSAVSLWALVPVIGTLFFFSPGGSIPWFAAFVTLSVASGIAEPGLAEQAAGIPEPVRAAFFVLNIVGVSFTAYTLLQYAVRARDRAHAQSESLLLNVLPGAIAQRLKRDRGRIADRHPSVTVLFADIAGFTPFTERTDPDVVVGVLDEIFSSFDELTRRYGGEKIKTIGDAYMVALGVPEPRTDHAHASAELALEMRETFARLCKQLGVPLGLRIGIDSGPAIAGVIGRHKFSYDLWGRTINTASRMEMHGLRGEIQVSQATFEHLRGDFILERRGDIDIKGQGRRPAYLLRQRRRA
jgi:adenylate cyclase